MGLADWDIGRSDVNTAVLIDPFNPLVDLGSLRIDFTPSTGADSSVNLIPSDASGNNHGFTRGKIRTVFRLDDAGDQNPTDEWFFGVTAMQSQDNMTGGGLCYAAGLLVGTTHSYILAKYNAGMVPGAGSFSVLNTGGTVESGEGFVRTMELEWNTNGAVAILTVRRGINPDFSDLTPEFTHFDVSPLFATVGEGLFAHDFEGTKAKIVTFESTRVFNITTA